MTARTLSAVRRPVTGPLSSAFASDRSIRGRFATPCDDAAAAPPPVSVAERVRALYRPSTVQGVVLEWVLVLVAVLLCEGFWSWPAYALVVVWIGARQHALLVLMHEAAHYHLLPSRRAGEWLSDLLCAWPLLLSTEGFRDVHFQHRRRPTTAEDPDSRMQLQEHEYRMPKNWLGFALLFLRDVSGLGVLRLLPAGWCDQTVRFWPVDAVIGKNGAFAFFMHNGMRRRFDTPGTRPDSRVQLKRLGAAIRDRFP
jgi:Fatty acid desaturase